MARLKHINVLAQRYKRFGKIKAYKKDTQTTNGLMKKKETPLQHREIVNQGL